MTFMGSFIHSLLQNKPSQNLLAKNNYFYFLCFYGLAWLSQSDLLLHADLLGAEGLTGCIQHLS